jgi:hypothetical protein
MLRAPPHDPVVAHHHETRPDLGAEAGAVEDGRRSIGLALHEGEVELVRLDPHDSAISHGGNSPRRIGDHDWRRELLRTGGRADEDGELHRSSSSKGHAWLTA